MPPQSPPPNFGLPALGVGVGLRRAHADLVADARPPMPWFEFCPENAMDRGGLSRRRLLRTRPRPSPDQPGP